VVTFTADGSNLAVIHKDGWIRVYPLALEDAIGNALARVTRSFTDAECREYLHLEACPNAAP